MEAARDHRAPRPVEQAPARRRRAELGSRQARMLALQRSIGNAAVTRMLQRVAEPTGIEDKITPEETNPGRDGYYGGTYWHGVTSSEGPNGQGLGGVDIKETVTVAHNDLDPPSQLELQDKQIVLDEDAILRDRIFTSARRVHTSVERLKGSPNQAWPAKYSTPQKLWWKRAGRQWQEFAQVPIEVHVENISNDDSVDDADFIVRTFDNGVLVEQEYIGDGTAAPAAAAQPQPADNDDRRKRARTVVDSSSSDSESSSSDSESSSSESEID
jgi:hypothetical protein